MRLFITILVIASTTLTVSAQEKSRRGEIAIYGGAGHISAKEGTYGKGAGAGASVEFRPFERVGFMADINRLHHTGSISNVNGTSDYWDISGTAVQGSGSAVFHFHVPLQPYVLGGAGALRSSRDINIKNFVQLPVPCCFGSGQNIGSIGVGQLQIKQTDAEVHAGAGIRIPIAFGVAFRPEVRFVRAGDLHLVHAIFAAPYAW
jgi:Outer membrane protein beta-barrel domain